METLKQLGISLLTGLISNIIYLTDMKTIIENQYVIFTLYLLIFWAIAFVVYRLYSNMIGKINKAIKDVKEDMITHISTDKKKLESSISRSLLNCSGRISDNEKNISKINGKLKTILNELNNPK